MPDAAFENQRLADLSDVLDPDRSDLDAYVSLAVALDARSVLDIGCGTGTFACLLAQQGMDVVGVDPAAASVDVARRKSTGTQVEWVVGEATDLPPMQVGLVTMTANVAQVFVDDEHWNRTLRAAHAALRPGGHLVFETRVPERRAWLEWNREATLSREEIPGVGAVETWCDLISAVDGLVSFRWTYVFASDGAVLTSESTLRFRSQPELTDSLVRAGFVVDDIRDAPDRPGREWVYVARRS